MKQCDCLKKLNKQLNASKGTKGGSIVEFDLISGKTLSDFVFHEERGKNITRKIVSVIHRFCPFCGEKYKDEEVENDGK